MINFIEHTTRYTTGFTKERLGRERSYHQEKDYCSIQPRLLEAGGHLSHACIQLLLNSKGCNTSHDLTEIFAWIWHSSMYFFRAGMALTYSTVSHIHSLVHYLH